MQNRVDMPLMPQLHSIVIMSVFLHDYLPQDKDANRLPALRELTYDCIPPPFFDHDWRYFVQLCCKNVTTVYIDFCNLSGSLQKELDLLSECCPKLEKLVLFLRAWPDFGQGLILPPVSQLGLYCSVPRASPDEYRGLFAALDTMSATKLRVVRLLHPQTGQDLRYAYENVLTEGATRLSTCTFRLEDNAYNLMTR